MSKASAIQTRIQEALAALQSLGLPREQLNDRSALTLLALLDLKPNLPWPQASNPRCGVTPMMQFFARQYHKRYAPNTRETLRRFTVHQFEQAGLITKNPDQPRRPINSPNTVYQIEPAALTLLRKFKTPAWDKALAEYKCHHAALREKYAAARAMISVALPDGHQIDLSPGGQNPLIKMVIEQFCALHAGGSQVLYVGDARKKALVWEKNALRGLGVSVDDHGKMPDLVVHYKAKGWLLLIEAVISHGPMSPKRHQELKTIFGAVLIYAHIPLRKSAEEIGSILGAIGTECLLRSMPLSVIALRCLVLHP
ncbi:MAG: restriction endonuclease [Phycisphaerae bacterium]|nr:restriction endonuclease [Phycisphaerae bacterium]